MLGVAGASLLEACVGSARCSTARLPRRVEYLLHGRVFDGRTRAETYIQGEGQV